MKRRLSLCAAPGGGALLAALLGLGCASSTLTTAWRADSPVPPPRASLAVVPFENLSSSRNAGLILTDLATTLLYARPQFRVVEISSLSEDKEVRLRRLEVTPWERQVGLNTATAAAVGQVANVDWVLVGSVGEYGFVDGFGETATVGVNLRLLRVEGGEVVWAGSLSRRAACTAFSQESVHRLAHGVLRDLLDPMNRALEEHQRTHVPTTPPQAVPPPDQGTTNAPATPVQTSPDPDPGQTNAPAPANPAEPGTGK